MNSQVRQSPLFAAFGLVSGMRVPLQPYARHLRVNERSGNGHIEQRVGLDRRAADVQQFYADPPGSNIITIPR